MKKSFYFCTRKSGKHRQSVIDVAKREEIIEKQYNNQVRKNQSENHTLSERRQTYNGEFDPGSG